MKNYIFINDGAGLPVAYSEKTPQKLINILEDLRKRKTRVKLTIGDINTGKSWNEEHDITGRIGLSKGFKARYPILVYNNRSLGGGALMDDCILQIREANGGGLIYRAENFQTQKFEIRQSETEGYFYSVYIDGVLFSNHKTEREAKLLIKKLS